MLQVELDTSIKRNEGLTYEARTHTQTQDTTRTLTRRHG
jgi:hypothetical protein